MCATTIVFLNTAPVSYRLCIFFSSSSISAARANDTVMNLSQRARQKEGIPGGIMSEEAACLGWQLWVSVVSEKRSGNKLLYFPISCN